MTPMGRGMGYHSRERYDLRDWLEISALVLLNTILLIILGALLTVLAQALHW